MSDLVAARRAIDERRELAVSSLAVLERYRAGGDYPRRLVVMRCDHTHRSAKMPKLAEATIFDGHLLFASKIRWLPSDELTLRPWQRDHLEGAGSDATTAKAMQTDDEFLLRMLAANDDHAAGRETQGPRWFIRPGGPFVIAVALPLTRPVDRSPIGLWTRCHDHPEAMEEHSPVALTRSILELQHRATPSVQPREQRSGD